jgi:hypothetical protein
LLQRGRSGGSHSGLSLQHVPYLVFEDQKEYGVKKKVEKQKNEKRNGKCREKRNERNYIYY